MDYHWILFCPQLPSTPSSPRVMVWRRMRAAGSLGLDNGLWVLPYSAEREAFVREVAAYVEAQGGTSKTFLADAFDERTELEIHAGFRRDRAQEYFELVEQCQDFLSEIEKEIGRRNFTFAEYEENEQDLVKLEAWFEKVRARDFLGGEGMQETAVMLEKCRQALQTFAGEVFANEGFKDAQE